MDTAPYADDPLTSVTPALAARVPAALARKLGVVPLEYDPATRTLVVAMADPSQLDAIDQLTFATGLRVRALRAASPDLRRAVARLYPLLDGLAPPARGARGSVPPPVLPKLISFEESERRSRMWMKIILALCAVCAAFPLTARACARYHASDPRDAAVDPDEMLEGLLCVALPHRDWFRDGPSPHRRYRIEQTVKIEACTSGPPEKPHRLIAATVTSPDLGTTSAELAARVLDELAEPLVDESCGESSLRDELTVTCRGHREQLWAWRVDDDTYRFYVLRGGEEHPDEEIVGQVEGAIIMAE